MAVVVASAEVVLAPAALADPPAQTSIASAVPLDRSAQISFAAAADATTGEVLPDATYERQLGGGTWTPLDASIDPDTSLEVGTITGLTNKTTYLVRVRAVDADGPGPASDPISVTPGVPDDVAFSVAPDNARAVVTFTPPNSGGFDITGYDVSATTSAATPSWHSATVEADGATINVPGLTNRTIYYVAVRARNANGPGTASADPQPVVPGLPTAATLNSVTPDDQSVTISVTPPQFTGGVDLTGYDVSATTDESARNWKLVPLSALTDNGDGSYNSTVVGLSNGTPYFVAVRARNANGAGPASDAQSATPNAVPEQPTGVVAAASVTTDPSVAGSATADVSFTPVVGHGGTEPTAPTSYTVSSSDGAVSATCDAANPSPCPVTGLSNGTAYTFTVIANNDFGPSAASDPSNTVTPVGAPYAPTALRSVGASPRSATISFVPPADSGSPVTAYQLSIDGGTTWRTASTRADGARRVVSATGLRSFVRYALAVRAVNVVNGASRVGVPSAAIAVLTGPSTVPGRPSARAGTSAVLVQWPASRESNVAGYTVYSSRGAACTTQARTETSCVVGARAGLRTTFRVVARSSSGLQSYPSAASRVVIAGAPLVPRYAPGVPGGFSAHPKTVKAGKKATLRAPGFLPGSTVILVAYGKKRHVLRSAVATGRGDLGVSFRVPKDKARRLTFVAFGVTPDPSAKAVGVSIKKRGRR